MTKNAIGHLRVSSKEQQEGISLDQQEAFLKSWGEREGVRFLFFVREVESAKTSDRRELQALVRWVEAHPAAVDLIVVYDFSRYMRSLYDALKIERRLAVHGVVVVSATMPIPPNAMGRAFRNMQHVWNQLDNEQKSEKVVANMQHALAQGRWVWRAPYGYRNVPDGVEVDPLVGPALAVAIQAVAKGEGQEIARRRLVEETRTTVSPTRFGAILRSPFYAGDVVSTKWGITATGVHEPLVDRGTWSRLQERLQAAQRAGSRKRASPGYPLRGIVACGGCGKPLTASSSRGRSAVYDYYHCWSCREFAVRADELEESFRSELTQLSLPPGMARLVSASIRIELDNEAEAQRVLAASVTRRSSEIRGKRDRLTEAFVCGETIDQETYARLRERFDRELTELHLEPLSHSAPVEELAALAEKLLAWPHVTWDVLPNEDKQEFARLVFPEGLTYGSEGLRTGASALFFKHFGARIDPVERWYPQRELLRTSVTEVQPWLNQAYALLVCHA